MSESMAPAGWYPVDQAHLRYWDGQRWTEHTHPRQDGGGVSFDEPQRNGDRPAARAGVVANRLMDTTQELPEGTAWSAVGRPVTGIGAGRYRMDAHYLYFEKGTLRTDSQQVPVANVLDVDVRQSFTQKARDVYTVLVHVQRPNRIEVVTMEDIPEGRAAQQQINAAAHAARALIQRHQNTMRYEGQATSLRTDGPSPAVPGDGGDLVDRLKELAKLRDAGVLTEEEFATKKAEILARI